MSKRICKDDQIRLITKCRQSGLSDYQWCHQNGIHPGTFYNWVSRLRKEGYTFPESESRTSAVPNVQEVVKVDIIQPQQSGLKIEQNTSVSQTSGIPSMAAELIMGGVTLRLFPGADGQLVRNILHCIGGMDHAW